MMNLETSNGSLPIKSIFKGGLTVVLVILFFTVFLGILTQMGWTGTIKWAGSLYLIVIYLSIVIGSITGGMTSGQMGWVTGIGVGLIASILILVLAMIARENIAWPIYLLKTMLNSFIGAFGGIIGVNLSKK